MTSSPTDTDLRSLLVQSEGVLDSLLLGYIRNQIRDLDNIIRRAEAERHKAEGQIILAQAQKLQIVNYLRSLTAAKEAAKKVNPDPPKTRKGRKISQDTGTPTP